MNHKLLIVFLSLFLLIAALNTTKKVEKMSKKKIRKIQAASRAEQKKVMARMPRVGKTTLTETAFEFERRDPWYIKKPMGGPSGYSI